MVFIILKNIRKIYGYSKGFRKYIVRYTLCIPLVTLISIIVPIYTAKQIIFINNGTYNSLITAALIIFFFEIMRNIIRLISSLSIGLFFRESVRVIQLKALKSLLSIKNKDLDSMPSGVVIERVNNDCSKIADCIPNIIEDLSEILSNVGIIVTIFFLSKILFLYLITASVIIFIFNRIKIKKWAEFDKQRRKANEYSTSFICELIRGIRDIKVLNANKSFLNEAENRIKEKNKITYKGRKFLGLFRLLIGSISDLLDLCFILIAVYLLKNNLVTITALITVYMYKNRIYYIFNTYSNLQEYLKDFEISSTRVLDIIEGDKYERESFGNKELKKAKGNFEFKNVKFSYKDGIPVLKNLSFKIKANTTVAFVGKSGSGKTTIFNLLAKLYDIDDGEILMDDININELTENSIRGNMTIINQSPYIFNLSIKDNLKITSPNATNKDIKEACKLANLDEFIDSLPDKYDTVVGEGGITLSGGQKQRLAIARALLQKTEIILFDEATSALDNETQEEIQKAIDNMKNEYTILIIAHRFSTVINSDNIYFMEDGVIKAEGKHTDLLKKSKEYKELYEKELKEN